MQCWLHLVTVSGVYLQLSDDGSTSITKLREGKENKGKWLARRVGLLLSRWRH